MSKKKKHPPLRRKRFEQIIEKHEDEVNATKDDVIRAIAGSKNILGVSGALLDLFEIFDQNDSEEKQTALLLIFIRGEQLGRSKGRTERTRLFLEEAESKDQSKN